LVGQHVALVFEKHSYRARCAFEVAAVDQGARVTFIGPDGSDLGRDESLRDTARVLGRLYDGIGFVGCQESAEQLAAHASVPVWNAGTNLWRPSQMLADVLTMAEHFDGPLEEVAVCFTGVGESSVARSLLVTGALLGMDVRIAAPTSLQPSSEVVALAHQLADDSGARITITDDPCEAMRGADFVYTDAWVRAGESEQAWAQRIEVLLPYRVTAELVSYSGKHPTRFMHCLPSLHSRGTALGARLYHRFGLDGVEVTAQVFESPDSVVFDQAENRMHSAKALLVAALAG
jgi:ornithine carbamoyltransferase